MCSKALESLRIPLRSPRHPTQPDEACLIEIMDVPHSKNSAMTRGILSRRIVDTPIAVIDFETTGLSPGIDRVVEVSVVRVEPGQSPRVVFDTLINPNRPMAATEIHHIRDADVKHAPRFADIAGNLLAATEDCVIAAYNVYFDIKFLSFELAAAGVAHQPPHLCLMYLRPMLGLGAACKLTQACRAHRVDYNSSHVASDDALAASRLFETYLGQIRRLGVATFADLAELRSYKFTDSFSRRPFPGPQAFGLRPTTSSVVSRAGWRTAD
jgi:DNA polymerase-3 subunit epsilon